MEWQRGIAGTCIKWRGKHYINAAYKGLQRPTLPQVANYVLEEMRQQILSEELTFNLQVAGLYRLWCIPWKYSAV
ncbi:UNVERIFIED_CONTAM: hypothetical protein Sradi_6139600, partial [Sesamum radiatum]